MNFNILITDDSSVIRKIIQKALTISGFPIETLYEAGNGQEALAVLEAHPVDILVTDLNMPEMDGWALIQAVREHATLRDMTIVVISTEGSDVRKAELERWQVDGFLHKPFTPEQIRDTMEQVVGDTHV